MAMLNSAKEKVDFKYSGTKMSLAPIMKSGSTYRTCIFLPMDASNYTSITCGEFRPGGQTSVTENSPTLDIRQNEVIVITGKSSFSSYVGAEAVVNLTFT